MSEPAADFELDLEQAIAADRLDAVNRTVVRGAPFAVVASVLVSFLLSDSVSLQRKLVWDAIMLAAVVFSLSCALLYEERRKAGIVLHWRLGVVSSAVIGCAWGSLVVVAFPPADRGELRAILLVFAVGVSSVTLLSTAASRARFLAVNVPMTVIMGVVYLRSPDGTTRLLGLAIPLYLAVMAVMHTQVHHIVMSEMRLRHELRDAAMHDDLTGALNRRAFAHVVEAAVAQARRSGELVGLLYVDLDRFKSINDSFGHEAGDKVLIEVARRVREVLRAGDSFGRLGGDEFALLLRGLSSGDDVQSMADRVLDALAQPFAVGGALVAVGASVGGSVISGDVDGAGLLRESDAAQYRAKKAGGHRAITFDGAMRAELRRDRAMEHELRDALGDARVFPYFQPVVNLTTGHAIGCEALARWIDPHGDVVAAARFLGVARSTGLIDELDGVVMQQALDARVLLRDATTVDDFRMWLNVDAHRLVHGRHTRLREIIMSSDCERRELGIEITESEVLHDVDTAVELLTSARAAGMKVALDDFGTGYSSLMLLRRLPIDVLKIDRSFVSGLTTSANDRAIAGVIVRVGHDLGLQVVAEGVETEQQAAVLRELGCDAAQGFLFAPALPLADLVAFTRAAVRASAASR
jgi:diguanylate cyclase (GGDEF)-like protein